MFDLNLCNEEFNVFGIDIKILERNDLSLLCKWRNNPQVRKNMEDRREVNEMILNVWFNNILEKPDYLGYICSCNGKKFGYEEIKDINFETDSAVCGTYFDQEYINAGLFVNVFLCRELILRDINISTVIAKVRKENKNSISLQKRLGGVISEEDDDFFIFQLKKDGRIKALRFLAEALGLSAAFDKEFTEWSKLP